MPKRGPENYFLFGAIGFWLSRRVGLDPQSWPGRTFAGLCHFLTILVPALILTAITGQWENTAVLPWAAAAVVYGAGNDLRSNVDAGVRLVRDRLPAHPHSAAGGRAGGVGPQGGSLAIVVPRTRFAGTRRIQGRGNSRNDSGGNVKELEARDLGGWGDGTLLW